MTWIADAGLWAAIVLAGLVAGLIAPRSQSLHPVHLARAEGLLLAGAAAAVVAWCATAGEILGAPASSALLSAFVPIDVEPGFRLAVLWATLPGAALTLGTVLLVSLAIAGSRGNGRASFILTVIALLALGAIAWFNPPRGVAPATIPPFVQSAPAAVSPLAALISLAALAWVVARAAGQGAVPALALQGAWVAATAAIVGEQMARSGLGIGPRDAVVLGSASSGLVLWVVTSALLHRRVQEVLLRATRPIASGSRLASIAAHAGAACLVISFAAHALASRATVSLPAGVPVDVADAFRRPWTLVNQGVSHYDAAGAEVTALALQAGTPGNGVALLAPEVREYHGRDGQHLATGIARRESTGGPLQAMRVLFIEADSLDVARVRITFLPAPILWPVGVALLALAALASLSTGNAARTTNAHDELT